MMRRRVTLLFLFFLAPPCWPHPLLLYADRIRDNRALGSGNPYTSIYAYNPLTKENKLVFSDENADFFLRSAWGSGGQTGGVIVTSRTKVFAVVAKRTLEALNSEGTSQDNTVGWLGEIHLDGSNRYKKVGDIKNSGPLNSIFVNSQGTRIGYLGCLTDSAKCVTAGASCFLFIQNVSSGKVISQIDMDAFDQLGESIINIGYFPAGNQIVFVDEPEDDPVGDEKEKIHVIHDDGTGIGEPPIEVNSPSFVCPVSDKILTSDWNGHYVFLDQNGWSVRKIKCDQNGFLYCASPDQTQVAFEDTKYLDDDRELSRIWILNLQNSGLQRFDPPEKQGDDILKEFIDLVGWVDEK